MSATRARWSVTLAAALLLVTGCSSSSAEPRADYTPGPVRSFSPSPAPVATPTTEPAEPAEQVDIVITFYGSDIQVLGSTYDDTPATEDRGRVPDGYQVVIPPDTGFHWGAVSWNGEADAGCTVTQGDTVLLDNSGPDQTSASCVDYVGF